MPRRPSPVADLPDRWNKRTARHLLAEWRASGGSLARFARERGLRADRLRWWKKQLGDEERARSRRMRAISAPPLRFVPAVATATVAAPVTKRVIVRLPGGIEIEATSVEVLPPAWLASVARTLVFGA
jgi:hypothetical protein